MGGVNAKRGDWGWVAFYDTGRSRCGGTLINSQFILTAAHCFADTTLPTGFNVYLGLHNKSSVESWVQIRKASKVHKHPNFNTRTFHNDITLIKLDKPVNVDNKYIVLACYDKIIDVSNKDAWVVGWGSESVNGNTSVVRKQVKVKISTDRNCKNKFKDYSDKYNICDLSAGNSGACQGDSGSPLVYKNDNKWYAVGIVSYTERSCGSGTVYTRVSHYTNWIKQKIAEQ